MVSCKLSNLFITLTFIFCVGVAFPAQTLIQHQGLKQLVADSTSTDNSTSPVITYKLIPGINNTWGYDILVDKRVKVHQPSIPAIPGNEGFKTREKAEKVARLVIKKMKNGETLPGITKEELKNLKVI